MRNKLHFLLSFCILSFFANAQIIRLQKNATLNAVELKHNKKISLIYKSDKGLVSFKGKVYNYKFPFLYIKNKKDTLVIDVRKVEEIKFTSPNIALYYIGAFLPAVITIGLISGGMFVDGGYSISTAFAIIPGSLTYLIIKSGHRKLNTKTEWSFY